MEWIIEYKYWVMGICLWFSLGWFGFLAWEFEMYIKGYRMVFKEHLKMYAIMVSCGLFSWIMGFTSVKNYLG